LRLFSFGGYGLALAALALVVFGAIECPPELCNEKAFRNITVAKKIPRISVARIGRFIA